MGMGAADVIPGVSGGTIAFITGIYEELVNSIKSINLEALKLFFTGRWKSFWKHINGNFLLAVFGGVFISVLSLAKVLEHLLENHPILIWSFFFGLILASSYVVSRKIKNWEYANVVALISRDCSGVLYHQCNTCHNHRCILVCCSFRRIGKLCHDPARNFR